MAIRETADFSTAIMKVRRQQNIILKGFRIKSRTAKVSFKNDDKIKLFINKNRVHHQETSK